MALWELIPAASLELYRREVLRWNQQINLISRRHSEQHLDLLIEQCLQGVQALLVALSAWDPAIAGPLAPGPRSPAEEATLEQAVIKSSPCLAIDYKDLGSGAGLPGLIWHLWLQGLGEPSEDRDRPRLQTTLVEPRAKRAWFLQRMMDMLSLRNASVLARRWPEIDRIEPRGAGQHAAEYLEDAGQKSRAGETPRIQLWLFSLKALVLSDEQIWEGWRLHQGRQALLPGESLAICRFRSPGAGPDAEESRRLGLPSCRWEPGVTTPLGTEVWGIFPGPEPGPSGVDLLVSLYGGPSSPRMS